MDMAVVKIFNFHDTLLKQKDQVYNLVFILKYFENKFICKFIFYLSFIYLRLPPIGGGAPTPGGGGNPPGGAAIPPGEYMDPPPTPKYP